MLLIRKMVLQKIKKRDVFAILQKIRRLINLCISNMCVSVGRWTRKVDTFAVPCYD